MSIATQSAPQFPVQPDNSALRDSLKESIARLTTGPAPEAAQVAEIVPPTQGSSRHSVSLMDLVRSAPFLIMHAAAIYYALTTHFKWPYLVLCLGTYYVRMFAITGGYHRYFSHRSYKTNRVTQFLIALLGTMAAQKGVLWWAANHRLHHKNSDKPEDIHSPLQRGFWWSHVGWIVSSAHDETHWEQIPDLAKYPELRWLNRWWIVPPVALGVLMFFTLGLPAFTWGFLVSTVLLWHGTFFINSLAHVWGNRRYQTTDTSRNNFFLAVLTLGEGWHNNHHTYMSSTRQGFFWYEIDVTYYIIKAMSWVGLTSGLRKPPLELLEAKRIHKKAAHRESEALAS